MNLYEEACRLIDEYIQEHGNTTTITRHDLLAWLHRGCRRISETGDNLNLKGLCYNLYNDGMYGYPDWPLCLIYLPDTKEYRLVGSHYPYTGNVYHYYGTYREVIHGEWNNGVFTPRN